MIKTTVRYENRFAIEIEKAFNLTKQWLASQHKAKIKKSTPSSLIEAKQGTMMTNTGHDPNWKKRISISFYQLELNKTLIRIEATPLARNIFRIEKLKKSWYNGLFSHLFSLLQGAQETRIKVEELKVDDMTRKKTKYCPNCGKEIDKDAVICPRCGIDLK
jgi:hypothetical protein